MKTETVPDSDLELGGGGGPSLQTNFFLPFGPQFGLRIRGAGPPGPSPGSITVKWLALGESVQLTLIYYHVYCFAGVQLGGEFPVKVSNYTTLHCPRFKPRYDTTTSFINDLLFSSRI